jgi:hypothetical protein
MKKISGSMLLAFNPLTPSMAAVAPFMCACANQGITNNDTLW